MPDGVQSEDFRELHLLIPSDTHRPDLAKRFELANALARTIFGMHTLHWFHGNVSTRNVVFWSRKGDVEADLSHPCLMGFGMQGPSSRYEMTQKYREKGINSEYYRHPDFKESLKADETRPEPTIHTFKPSYDIYSLGLVLWEIGTWETLSSGFASDSDLDSDLDTEMDTDRELTVLAMC